MSDLNVQNNVLDPLLFGKELPSYKFELEKSKGKILGNSFGKEETVEQLPISKGVAAVSMQLEPGVMRELHWHATAAEWAFVLKGHVRTTVINPAGQTETNLSAWIAGNPVDVLQRISAGQHPCSKSFRARASSYRRINSVSSG